MKTGTLLELAAAARDWLAEKPRQNVLELVDLDGERGYMFYSPGAKRPDAGGIVFEGEDHNLIPILLPDNPETCLYTVVGRHEFPEEDEQ